MAKLKVAGLSGLWSGVLEVNLEEWTLPMLKEEVARRSSPQTVDPDTINLISTGRVLKDDAGSDQKNLSQLGIKNNAKIMATQSNAAEGASIGAQLQAEEQRSASLARLKAAAAALAKRHAADGSLPLEDFNIELEDQSGQKVDLGSETDQRAIMMGLMLHAKGKRLIKRQQYMDALEVLAMGEEAFSLCDNKLIERIDNVPILQIDMVWCYFMLRDVTWLSAAGVRLAKARGGIERAHGKDASRVRLLQGGRSPELALHMRLELLEAVVAYHCGELAKCRGLLTSAKTKFSKLQVSDEALSMIMSMGYTEKEARRALKMNNQNVENAVSFIIEEREKQAKQNVEDRQRQKEIKELKKYGKTPLGKAVDLPKLNYLVGIGFERELAAEVLRRNENETHKSLDDLTNPEINSNIQNDIESRKRKRKDQQETIISELIFMGFDRIRVTEAVQAHPTREGALNALLAIQPEMYGLYPMNHNPVATSSDLNPNLDGEGGTNNGDEDSSSGVAEEERDIEMENELADELDGGDALADYDIDVTKEAEAIDEYLAMLDSSSTSKSPSDP